MNDTQQTESDPLEDRVASSPGGVLHIEADGTVAQRPPGGNVRAVSGARDLEGITYVDVDPLIPGRVPPGHVHHRASDRCLRNDSGEPCLSAAELRAEVEEWKAADSASCDLAARYRTQRDVERARADAAEARVAAVRALAREVDVLYPPKFKFGAEANYVAGYHAARADLRRALGSDATASGQPTSEAPDHYAQQDAAVTDAILDTLTKAGVLKEERNLLLDGYAGQINTGTSAWTRHIYRTGTKQRRLVTVWREVRP